MKKSLLALALISTALPAFSAEKTTIEVGYTFAPLFDITFERIMPMFNAKYPDIEVKFRAAYEDYEAATNTVLREAVSGNLPDVTLQGLNRQNVLVEKGIARSLDGFIAAEGDFDKQGYHQAMLGLSTFDEQVFGLPFAVSLPVSYYNMDRMAKVGITEADQLPTTWDEVIEVCYQLQDAGMPSPMYWGWNVTGNWFLQAMFWTQDNKKIIEGNDFQLDTPEGLVALQTIHKLFRECNVQNLPMDDAGIPFANGDLAMHYWSTSSVGAIERAKGDFALMTAPFPGLDGRPDGLPAGGNAAMLTSTSEDPAVVDAAWKFLQFITSGEGAAVVAETTGYMPPNKGANALLADFYAQNPAKAAAVEQADLLRDWLAFPGDNGLAISQVLHDGIEGILTGEYDDMVALQAQLTEEVQELLPASN